MKIVNVKTPVIELLFNQRDSENTEKNREGSLCLCMSYDEIKNNIKEMRAVRELDIGMVLFWMGFSCDSDIHLSPGIGLNYFLFSQLI